MESALDMVDDNRYGSLAIEIIMFMKDRYPMDPDEIAAAMNKTREATRTACLLLIDKGFAKFNDQWQIELIPQE
jgi:transcription initiation factor IIE alpha subunit